MQACGNPPHVNDNAICQVKQWVVKVQLPYQRVVEAQFASFTEPPTEPPQGGLWVLQVGHAT